MEAFKAEAVGKGYANFRQVVETSHPSLSTGGILRRQILQAMAGVAEIDGLKRLTENEAKVMLAEIGKVLPKNVNRLLQAAFYPTRKKVYNGV